jgi:hypothetical protein
VACAALAAALAEPDEVSEGARDEVRRPAEASVASLGDPQPTA